MSEVESAVFQRMAVAAHLGASIRVVESPQPADEPDLYATTESARSSSAFVVTLFPAFFALPAQDRREVRAHEIGHMVLHMYATTASRVAKRKADREHLDELEEDLADRIGRLVLSACYEAGVDFGEDV